MPDTLTHGRDDAAHVAIECLGAIGMRDNDIVAVAAIPRAVALGDNDLARRGGINARALGRADINRVPAVEPLSDDARGHGPGKVARECRAATAEERLARGGRSRGGGGFGTFCY